MSPGAAAQAVVLAAPAKLNFGLRILARRSDGYHEIESLMLPLDLCDSVRLAPAAAPGIALRCEGAELPAGPENLATRGAAAACRALGLEPQLELQLTKRIPVAAGLGGGSSDAAAALRAVELLAGKELEPAERLALARGLGADVPFFLDPRPAAARGIGDLLEPLAGLPELAWLLVALPFAVPTPEIYREASRELTLPRSTSSIAALSALYSLADPLGAPPPGGLPSPENDLERVTGRRHPEVGAVQRSLRRLGARVTGMSGSGPTVYANFANRQAAAAALAELRLPEGARAWVVRSPASAQSEPRWGVAKR